ncbi:hypothetical protein [Legionella gresilensis]|uniref:hypothetical protein n=1 Tax=Legionella gresilensis TaxID=91823 RepID=UPI001040E31F|nr:hypothetical protein [Legionella gresilensis]
MVYYIGAKNLTPTSRLEVIFTPLDANGGNLLTLLRNEPELFALLEGIELDAPATKESLERICFYASAKTHDVIDSHEETQMQGYYK